MAEYIEKWSVVNRLIDIENEFQQYKPFHGFEHAMYRKICEAEIAIGKTQADVIALAQMLYGEARGCTVDNQMKCVWCVLNRVDDTRFPDTIQGVLSQPNQFYGYSPNFPVWDELKEVARDVLTRWSLEKQGVAVERELPTEYVFFTGDGIQNNFRDVY